MAEDQIKYVLLGSTQSGKTSIVYRLVKNVYREDTPSSIGAEFHNHEETFPSKETVKLDIWDTAGHNRYRTLSRMYTKGANIVAVVFDITSIESFEDARTNWVNEINEHRVETKDSTIFLVGNKVDIVYENKELRKVGKKDAEQFAKKNGMYYIEVSAKTGYNVKELFFHSVSLWRSTYRSSSSSTKFDDSSGEEVDGDGDENKEIKNDKKDNNNKKLSSDDPNFQKKKKGVLGGLFSSVSKNELGDQLQGLNRLHEISSDEENELGD